ncbi:MAG TPA: hypothetical protein VH682_18130 [Gemmataceae bacterium]|jgi:hypothetical protein
MTTSPLFPSARIGTAPLALFCLCLLTTSAAGAEFFEENSSFGLWDLGSTSGYLSAPPAPMPVSRAPRIRLFCIAPGFLSDPVCMQDEDSDLPGVPNMPGSNLPPGQTPPDNGPEWVQFGMGYDNPYFDLRRPGDPGGVGYYRVNTQVQLFDSPTTACTVGVQAVTPAGVQFAGLPDGPTVLCPAFSVFHALGEGTAIQGFVAKNVPVSGADGPNFLQRNLQYGMAVQRPVVADGPEGLRNVFLSVGALGQLHPQGDSFKALPTCDVLPGLQWHVNDNWWVSSGVLLPVGTTRTTPSQWQLTCFFQF